MFNAENYQYATPCSPIGIKNKWVIIILKYN